LRPWLSRIRLVDEGPLRRRPSNFIVGIATMPVVVG
jgi:hypothetical protein